MSGRPIYTDMKRRDFLKRLFAFTALPAIATMPAACNDTSTRYRHIKGGILGANHKTGHLLRNTQQLPAPSETRDVNILIIGSGISGLSARRWLGMHGVEDVLMIEMDSKTGGNSVYGENDITAYPWAAHYLPVPDVQNKELIDFLQSCGVITGYNNGLPVYNDYHLCHDPEERLLINGYWQEGLVPAFGVNDKERAQIAGFFHHIEELKLAKGNDNKYAFAIPVDASSADETYRKLDTITFNTYLQQRGYDAPHLLWYLEYCCKDDYGASLQQTSAWAGLHYFASRKGTAANATGADVLTWPEGNGFLMKALRGTDTGNIIINTLACKVALGDDDKIEVHCYDAEQKQTTLVRANKVIMCTPQYINKHILQVDNAERNGIYDIASYAPWVVANITLQHIPEGKGATLSWDNVVYGRESVGYVRANHQSLKANTQQVITYYLPVIDTNPAVARGKVHTKDYEYWKQYIVNDLEYAHPGISASISQIDLYIWGHGMILPSKGYIWGDERRKAQQPIDDKIYFAHTDLSGISIFEEGFYQGIRSAQQIINSL